MEELRVVKNSQFRSVSCDYYGNGDGEFFVTRQQIGKALEYDNPQKAIDKRVSSYYIVERRMDGK